MQYDTGPFVEDGVLVLVLEEELLLVLGDDAAAASLYFCCSSTPILLHAAAASPIFMPPFITSDTYTWYAFCFLGRLVLVLEPKML